MSAAPVAHAVQLLEPLYDVVTAIMVAFHTLFKSIGVNPGSGWAWGGAIVGLVVVIRILLIPLFVKQIKAQRGMQALQPDLKKIQEKYKGRTDPESRQTQQQEQPRSPSGERTPHRPPRRAQTPHDERTMRTVGQPLPPQRAGARAVAVAHHGDADARHIDDGQTSAQP